MRSYEIIILLAGSGAGQPGLVNTYFVAYIIETTTALYIALYKSVQ